MELNSMELDQITGGAIQINSTFINSICKMVTVMMDFGRALGSAIRYGISRKKC